MKSRNTNSKIALRISKRNLEKKMTPNSRKPKPRLLEQVLLILLLLLPVSFQTQPPF
jgi:hypothetical protein